MNWLGLPNLPVYQFPNLPRLAKPKLHPKPASGIVPLQGPIVTGDAAGATFQAALELDADVATFLVDRIEVGRADKQAVLLLAVLPADFLVDADVSYALSNWFCNTA